MYPFPVFLGGDITDLYVRRGIIHFRQSSRVSISRALRASLLIFPLCSLSADAAAWLSSLSVDSTLDRHRSLKAGKATAGRLKYCPSEVKRLVGATYAIPL